MMIEIKNREGNKQMTKRAINQWLKKNLTVYARVCTMRIGQATIGGDAGTDLHALADEIKTGLKAKTVWAYGLKSYLTINW